MSTRAFDRSSGGKATLPRQKTYRETPDVVLAICRMVRSVGKRVAEEDTDGVAQLKALDEAMATAWGTAIAGLRRNYSDREIGAALGVTRTALAALPSYRGGDPLIATDPDRALVATHRGFAAADDVLDALAELGEATADAVGERIGVSTRDVVATLNLLAGGDPPLVKRTIVTNPRDEDRTLAARWSLSLDGDA